METKITTKGVDIIIYLGIIITLIASVYNFVSIIFSVIDFKYSTFAPSYDIYNDSVRMAIAYLVIMFPIYLILSFYSTKVATNNIERINSKPRKFTIFASLFITALTLIGSLISTVYTYLGGELTTSFFLKVLTVVVVALLVGGYYLYSLLRDVVEINKVSIAFASGGALLVIISIVMSIMIFGTPSHMRDLRYDDQRLNDISNIQSQILNYWQSHKSIPNDLSQLNDPLTGFYLPTDPQTKSDYEYKVIKQSDLAYESGNSYPTDATFEICAEFITERNVKNNSISDRVAIDAKTFVQPVGFYYNSYDQTPFWNHPIGHTCFERTIKKEMYTNK